MSLKLNYDSPSSIAVFLDKHGFSMRKRFGQNFLISPAIRKRLVDALDVKAGEGVWEIGPGLGAMTTLLLESGAHVTAFEIDSGFCRLLIELFAHSTESSFKVIEGDVLKTWNTAPPAPYLLGNLPYGIAAVLIGNLIEAGTFFTRMVVTVQKEVAERIIAGPGSKNYSSLAVLCASVYTVKALTVIKPASFYPVPHVNSMALRFDLRKDCDPASYPCLFHTLVRHLFSARRKAIRNNLQVFHAQRGGLQDSSLWADSLLESCSLSGMARVESLSLQDFLLLAQNADRMQSFPRHIK